MNKKPILFAASLLTLSLLASCGGNTSTSTSTSTSSSTSSSSSSTSSSASAVKIDVSLAEGSADKVFHPGEKISKEDFEVTADFSDGSSRALGISEWESVQFGTETEIELTENDCSERTKTFNFSYKSLTSTCDVDTFNYICSLKEWNEAANYIRDNTEACERNFTASVSTGVGTSNTTIGTYKIDRFNALTDTIYGKNADIQGLGVHYCASYSDAYQGYIILNLENKFSTIEIFCEILDKIVCENTDFRIFDETNHTYSMTVGGNTYTSKVDLIDGNVRFIYNTESNSGITFEYFDIGKTVLEIPEFKNLYPTSKQLFEGHDAICSEKITITMLERQGMTFSIDMSEYGEMKEPTFFLGDPTTKTSYISSLFDIYLNGVELESSQFSFKGGMIKLNFDLKSTDKIDAFFHNTSLELGSEYTFMLYPKIDA